jgi:hypothetical protein
LFPANRLGEPLVLLSHEPVCARCLVHLQLKTFEG